MSPRALTLLLAAAVLLCQACAIEPVEPQEPAASQSNSLTPSDYATHTDPPAPDSTATSTDEPGNPLEEKASGGTGKPSPDPWMNGGPGYLSADPSGLTTTLAAGK
jgi:hypothetical protein